MLDTKKLLTKILKCLYVKGSSGDWTYKKYADGTCEMWFKGTKTVTIGTGAGNIYTSNSNTALAFPFALQAIEYSSVSAFSTSYGIWAWQVQETTSQIACRVFSNASRSSASYNFRAYVKGTWQ